MNSDLSNSVKNCRIFLYGGSGIAVGGIKDKLGFLMEYIRHPRTVGAVWPSGKGLSAKMMEPVEFDKASCIVEYGPGTGAFTRELLLRKRLHTTLIIIEQNKRFCRIISKMIRENTTKNVKNAKDVILIHGDAAKVNIYLKKYGFKNADYVVSGLPFTSLPESVSDNILKATIEAIGENGRFITFQYTRLKENFFRRYFTIKETLRECKNIPPANVYVCGTC